MVTTALLPPLMSKVGKSPGMASNGGARNTRTQRDVETDLLKLCTQIISCVTLTTTLLSSPPLINTILFILQFKNYT